MNLLPIKEENTDLYYFRLLGKRLCGNHFITQQQGRFGIVDFDFKTIVPAKFEEIQPAYKNHFWGKTNSEWNLYSLSNKKINLFPLLKIEAFTLQYACVSANGADFGFVDRKGKWIIDPTFAEGKYLGLNFFIVRKPSEEYYALIDNSGRKLTTKSFIDIPTFSELVLWQLKTRKPLKEWLKL